MKKVMLCIFSLIFILFAACTGVSFLVEDWMTPEVSVASARNRSDPETGTLPAALASVPPAGTAARFVCCLPVLLLSLFTRYNAEPVEGVPLAQSRNRSVETGMQPAVLLTALASASPAGTAVQFVRCLPVLILFLFTRYNAEPAGGVALAEIKG